MVYIVELSVDSRGVIVPVKTKRENLFCGEVFRVFDRGQNNCYFDSAVKDTNIAQYFLRHRLVLTDTIHSISFYLISSHCSWSRVRTLLYPP